MSDALSRYQSRHQQLSSAASSVGGTLEAAGDLLRRSGRVGTQAVEPALRGLTRPQIETWLQGLKIAELRSTLLKAAEEAVEAGLGEGGEESELWRTSAMEGLSARDRAASAARALGQWEALHGALEGTAAQRRTEFLQALGKMDAALRPRARWFIPLNPHRRQERDLLDKNEQLQAWWFSARADCDDLVATWTQQPRSLSSHLQSCPDCRADLSDTGIVDEPPRRHLSSDELWRMDMGLMPAEERARMESHTQSCSECAQAVLALEEGDEAIAEALADEGLEMEAEGMGRSPSARTSRAPAPRRPGARLPEQREVLEERRDFRVLLVRERQRVRLLVQPLSGRTVTAAVFLSPGKPSLKPAQGPEGLSFELGAEAGGARSAHVTVQAGGETLERDFTF
jgi:hypothetical protein